MKKSRFFNVLVTAVLVLVGILLNACWKPNLKEIKIDQESKDYCLFGQGSYWIYQDSATLKIDSVVINNPIYYDFSRSVVNGCISEDYTWRVSCYSHDPTFYSHVLLTAGNADPKTLKPCIFMKGGAVIYHNGDIGETVRSIITLSEKKDNYSINGITYSNVKIFEYANLGEQKIYYWAKHIGLIREEVYLTDSVLSIRNLIKHSVKSYNQ